MNIKLAVLPGDGIGPEIVDGAVEVLKVIGDKYGHTFNFTEYLAGGCRERAKSYQPLYHK